MQRHGRKFFGYHSMFFRFVIWLFICAFFLPAPVLTASANENPHNGHVLRRLNSPERQAAIEEMHRANAALRDAEAQTGTAASVAPVPRENALAQHSSTASGANAAVAAEASRPQSATEVLFNYAAGFAGVPGLSPRQGADGSLDEGLGFHQDGTARKAGGVAGSSGPSANGQRARTYMQSGMPNGYGQGLGMSGYGAGFGYSDPNDPLGSNWWRGDSTRGGRVSGSGAYSRDLGDFDPMNMAIDRGLNYGAGFVNSMGEAALSGLVDGGRARLNFRLDRDGYFSGEGDALLPFYDSARTTIYTQLGARSMHDSSDTRWIGNFGLGQRWFPLAQGDDLKAADYDAGQLMLGYNAFFDYDFTRDHQRGGFGVEAWYDWLRLSSNYYFPLSDWKGSEDFDSRFVKERPAEGWDARVKAYLPFYRNVALTGAYSQWYGDHVGMFGADRLEKDPKVWSYGVEYTPVPLVSGFITQKSTERGRTDTEFGLTFTYHFQMPWEDQISHAKVAELRTVGGSRHEFVDRENRIILEYKAKNSFRVEYLGRVGTNTFKFRLSDGFGKSASGKTASVSLSGAAFAGALTASSFTANGSGEFAVLLDSVTSTPVTATIQAGSNTQIFTLADATLTGLSISPAALPNATVNTLYSQLLAGSGGTGPYTISSPSLLPAWLSLTGNTLSGTPTAVGTHNFTLTVTDTATGNTADQAFTLVVSTQTYSLGAFTVTESYSSGKVTKTIKVTLSGGSGVSGKTINWTRTTGTLSASSSVTDGSGEATITLEHSILESSSVTATLDSTGVTTTETVYFGPQGAPRLDMSSITNGVTYDQAVAHCGSYGGLPTIAEMQTLSTLYGNDWWGTNGVGVGVYRPSDGTAPYHGVVFMPDGYDSFGTLNDSSPLEAVCLAP